MNVDRSASGEMAYDGVAGADAAVYPRLFIGGVLRTWLDEKPEALLSALHPRTLQPIHVSSQLLHRSGGESGAHDVAPFIRFNHYNLHSDIIKSRLA